MAGRLTASLEVFRLTYNQTTRWAFAPKGTAHNATGHAGGQASEKVSTGPEGRGTARGRGIL